MPRLGDLQVNDTDYEGDIVIEQYSYYNFGEPMWAVPAWDEGGAAPLAGPFHSRGEAEIVLEAWKRGLAL